MSEQITTRNPMDVQLSRRGVLLGAVGLAALAACSTGNEDYTAPDLPQPSAAEDYVPFDQVTILARTNSTAGAYELGQTFPLKQRDIINVGYFEPQPNVSLTDTGSPDIKLYELMQQMSAKGVWMGMSIGGPGGFVESKRLLDLGWQAAGTEPGKFAAVVDESAAQVEQLVGVPINNIDLAWQYPTGAQRRQYIDIVTAIKTVMPERRITMTVPAEPKPENDFRNAWWGDGFDQYDAVDAFNLQTFGLYGPDSAVAGPIAPGTWVSANTVAWSNQVGRPKRIRVGYTSEAVRYFGAKNVGDKFLKPPTREYLVGVIPYSTLPRNLVVTDDTIDYSSSTHIEGDYTSLQPPSMVSSVNAKLRVDEPDFGGSFFDNLAGLIPEHIRAVRLV